MDEAFLREQLLQTAASFDRTDALEALCDELAEVLKMQPVPEGERLGRYATWASDWAYVDRVQEALAKYDSMRPPRDS